ncbi:MAG: hypothetical protein K2M34_05310 [Alphaproteobacteria bacterium]|nr:hypothetical protein [Alphaproteobacteria bacterium]
MVDVDYVQTIDKFFTEVETYLTQRMEHAKDRAEAVKIQKTRFAWGMIKAVPRKYINEKFEDINMLPSDGFMRGDDNALYRAVCDVLNAIRNLYRDSQHGWIHMTEQHHSEFLNAYKRWKYQSSTSVFKDFVFPFRAPVSFAVQSKKKTK